MVVGLDLFELFVVQTFGSFWLSVIGLSVVLFIIMAAFGRMSYSSVTDYIVIFWFAMASGYGYRLICLLIFAGTLTWFWFQMNKAITRSGY